MGIARTCWNRIQGACSPMRAPTPDDWPGPLSAFGRWITTERPIYVVSCAVLAMATIWLASLRVVLLVVGERGLIQLPTDVVRIRDEPVVQWLIIDVLVWAMLISVLCQVLPVIITRVFTERAWLMAFWSTVVYVHDSDPVNPIHLPAVITRGFLVAYCLLHGLQKSWWRGYWMATWANVGFLIVYGIVIRICL